MTDHTPEPWKVSASGFNVEASHETRTVCQTQPSAFMKADAARIVASVNACAGIETERLEAGSVAKLFTAADAISKYYVQSLNVGPGKYPKRESLLWRPLHAALAPFQKD